MNTKDLVFKERLAKKLVDQYVGLYIIAEVTSTNVVKLQLSNLMRIHLVVNFSHIRLSRGVEKERGKTSKSRRSGEMESGEHIK